jgi:hypothetical protein
MYCRNSNEQTGGLHRAFMLRTIRNVAISIVTLLVIFAGAGIGYVLLTGDDTINAKAEPVAPSPPPGAAIRTPRKPVPNAPESAGVTSLFSPVKIGQNTSMTVKTLPNSICTITFIYNNIASKDSGLAQKAADDYGNVTWAWTISGDVPVGKWPAKATCTYNKKSAVVIGDVEVTK